MIEFIENEIVENGIIVIDSIFRFGENPTELPALLEMCKKKNCTVKFTLEKIICEPNKELFMQEDSQELHHGLFITAFIGYMAFYKKFGEKHLEYLTKLQGEHEPILVD